MKKEQPSVPPAQEHAQNEGTPQMQRIMTSVLSRKKRVFCWRVSGIKLSCFITSSLAAPLGALHCWSTRLATHRLASAVALNFRMFISVSLTVSKTYLR